MTSLRYESLEGAPRRLPDRTEPYGTRTGFPVWGAFLFGAVFVAAGAAIVLVGTKVIPEPEQEVYAPWWTLTAFGAVLALGGFMVWGMAVRQWKAEERRRAAVERYPDSLALADHAWDRRGSWAEHRPRAAKGVAGAVFMTLFLSIFNWWAFFTDAPWVVKLVTVLFDLLLVAVWWQTVVLVGRAWKFGGSWVEWASFPCSPSGPIELRWHPPPGAGRAERGSFTLRCKPPTGLPSTELSADHPVFWELEVALDLPGFDFEERYLVPVYGDG